MVLMFVAALALGLPGVANAAPILVTLDASALPVIGPAGDPYELELYLTDGDGEVNTDVTISDLTFLGATLVGAPLLTGDAGANVDGSVTLRDTAFFSSLIQSFRAAASVSFVITFSSAFSGLQQPDLFAFAIWDPQGIVSGSGPGLELLSIDFTATPLVSTFGAADLDGNTVLDAPVAVPVPEPATLSLLALGVGGAAILRRRTRRS
jgi:hypothetical protein